MSVDLVFTAGSSNGAIECTNVTIIDDMVVEEDETFIVTLTTSSSIVALGNNVTRVAITDTDSMYLATYVLMHGLLYMYTWEHYWPWFTVIISYSSHCVSPFYCECG